MRELPTLTPRQSKILSYMEACIAKNGRPPTVREILKGCKISSTSVVDYNLRALQRYGLVDWEPGLARTLRVLV